MRKNAQQMVLDAPGRLPARAPDTLMVFLLVLGCEFLKRLFDHFLLFPLDNLEIGLPARTAAPVFMIESQVTLAAVGAFSAFLAPIARIILEKTRFVPCV